MKAFRSIIFFIIILIQLFTTHLFAQDRPINIGISSMITPVDTVKYYDDIVKYIGKKLGRETKFIHRKKYEEMNKLIEKKEVDLAFICTASLIKLREDADVEVVAAPVKTDKPFYKSYIIVHKDSPIKSFEKLKGKTFVFVDPLSNTGYLYPLYRVVKLKDDPEQFFREYNFSYSHNKSIELVAKKLIDGAAVENLVYEYMKEINSPYVHETKVIEESEEFPSPPIVVRKDIDKNTIEKIKKIITNMHLDVEGKKILDNMRIKRFDALPDSAYNKIAQIEDIVSKALMASRRKLKAKDQFFLGVLNYRNPRLIYEKYQPLVDYLKERTGFNITLSIKNHKELQKGFVEGDIDIAIVGVVDYLNIRDKKTFDIIGVPKNKNSTSFYKIYIITKDDGEIKSLKDLKGKIFGFGPVKSDDLNFIPRLLLAKNGIHLNELKKFKHYTYEDSIIKALLKGEVDAGVIRDFYKEKATKLGFKIIGESDMIYYGPLIIRKDLSEKVKRDVASALFNMPQSVISKLDFDLQSGFTKAEVKNYDLYSKMFKEIPSGCGIRCHPR